MSKLLRRRSSSLLTEVFFGSSSGGGGGGGVSVLNDLLDVTVPAPTDQDILIYNAAQGYWENKPASTLATLPAPPEKAIQYNKNNQFAGSALFNYDDSTNYVGIGIDTPAVNLHVKGVGQSWSGLLMDGTDYASIRMKTNTGDFMWTSMPGGKFSLYEWSTNKYLFTVNTHAQIKFGGLYNSSSLEASATFEVADSGTYPGEPHRGALPAPRMTTSDRDSISNPACGLLVFNTDTNNYNVYTCGSTNTWHGIPISNTVTDGKVLYSKNNLIQEDDQFKYDDSDKRMSVEKISIGTNPPATDTNVYVKGDGQHPMKFFNDLGTGSDGYKFIAYFSRHDPAPGNAGFYAGYYVDGGDVAYTLLYAPGARDFAITTYQDNNGITNPSLYIADATGFTGINTKTPNSQLHVVAGAPIIARFSTTKAYGGIVVESPNMGVTNRVVVSLGEGFSAPSSGTVAYKKENGQSGSVEIYTGSTPNNTPMVRVGDSAIHLQAAEAIWATDQYISSGDWQTFFIKNNTFNSGVAKRIVFGAQNTGSNNRLNFSLGVNTDYAANDADPKADSVIFISGYTKNLGIQNVSPNTTVDINGAYRATADTPPPNAKWARFTFPQWDRDFVQLGKTTIPEMFRYAFEFQPRILEIMSLVDLDSWALSAGYTVDFGTLGLKWEASSASPGVAASARYSWGKALRYRTTQNKRYIRTKIENLSPKSWYLAIISLYHFSSSGTSKHSVMGFYPDSGDSVRLYYQNNRLYLQNVNSGTYTSVSYLSSGYLAVLGILFKPDIGSIVTYSSRWSNGRNIIQRVTLSNTTFPPDEPNNIEVIIGQDAETESPMNMEVHAFSLVAVPIKWPEEYAYRLVKRFSKLLV